MLIKAEAACRQNNLSAAQDALRQFKASRYTTADQPIGSSVDEVLKEVLQERKREFYMEIDYIWLDMKRLGESMTKEVNGETFTLEPYDYRYTFPIPKAEMERNKKMVQTPGWENAQF